MQLALIQTDIGWCEPETNRTRIDELIAKTPHSDLYLLPEMFPTGFVTSPESVAESAEGPTFRWMRSRAGYIGAAIVGSIPTEENGRYYNRTYFVRPDGTWDKYDKHHLFGAEKKCFTPGDSRTVAEWKGVRFLLATCYDLRFPVWLRNRGDYDGILIGASWPTSRRQAWDVLLPARAVENLCFVAAANRTGDDPSASYNGGSVLISPSGETICRCPDGESSGVTAYVDFDLVGEYRSFFPALDDADDFRIL